MRYWYLNSKRKKKQNFVIMHGMNYIGRVISNFKDFYNDINGATLTGAIDVVIVEQPDETYNCSPFHVRFGKIGVLRSREKVVDIQVNGEPLDIHMKLGESGEAFFVEEVPDSDDEDIPEHLATSPIPVGFEELYNAKGRRRNSLDMDSLKPPVYENEINDYTKRRFTASSAEEGGTTKSREEDFIKRQIMLGNVEVGVEASTEDLTLSLPSTNKHTSDEISKDTSISEPIFQMDSLELEINPPPPPPKPDEPLGEGKNGKKRRRKKSVMKKKNSQRKVSVESQSVEVSEFSQEIKDPESGTDRASLDSNISEAELKEKSETDPGAAALNNRKVRDIDFHFFSDTELTSGPADSRPASPTSAEAVLSDTEFEVKSRKEGEKDVECQSWAWGEFPSSISQVSSPESVKNADPTSVQAQHYSMLTSVFSFMKQQRQNNTNDGVYLADLSSGAIDPEVAALYFTKSQKQKRTDAEMDCESGNGTSIAQSPNSVEGCKSIDFDFDEQHKGMQDVALSLCGWDTEPNEQNFANHAVNFADLCNNPSLLESPKLVVRIHDKYYNWKVAMPVITSFMIYRRTLPQSTIDQLCNLHMTSSLNAEKRATKQESRGYSWWGWRRNRTSRESTPAQDTVINIDAIKSEEVHKTDPTEPNIDMNATKIEIGASEDGYYGSQSSESEHGKDTAADEKHAVTSKSGKFDKSLKSDKSDKCRKTLRLSTEQIKQLHLRDGVNEIEFSVTTAYQGTSRCKCYIYKWKWDDKIVISDIDGTITKSDVLGHILPMVGKDWAQSGVAQLFNKIKDNGYKLLYLSARAIGQASGTREYLRSIKQGDLYMPDGPMLLNPTSLITAFHREVIENKPEQFKISCMSDIRALFPMDSNPFYAGYGNKINDVWAYRAVGIPIVRIFTINPKGELKHELTQTFQSSYTGQSLVVNDVFPPLLNKMHTSDGENNMLLFNNFDDNLVSKFHPKLDYSQFRNSL